MKTNILLVCLVAGMTITARAADRYCVDGGNNKNIRFVNAGTMVIIK